VRAGWVAPPRLGERAPLYGHGLVHIAMISGAADPKVDPNPLQGLGFREPFRSCENLFWMDICLRVTKTHIVRSGRILPRGPNLKEISRRISNGLRVSTARSR